MASFCAACGAAIGEGLAYCGQCGLAAVATTSFAARPHRSSSTIPGWKFIVGGVAALTVIAMLVWLLQPSELEQEQARELITLNMSEPVTVPLPTEESVFPVNLSVDSQTGAFADFHQVQIDQARGRFERLRDAGYITFEEENITRYMFSSRLGNVHFRIKPTTKLEQFIAEASPNGRTLQIKIGQIVPDTIISIAPVGDDQRRVRFSRKVEMNELAPLLQTSEVPLTQPDAEVTFVRLDGEWVIQEQGEGSQ